MTVDRRDFLKAATVGAGLTAVGTAASAQPRRSRRAQGQDVVVIGAGNFGMWTALELQRQGASVTVVDAYGPANSRSTSGGETRGVRSSYGDRRHGFHWTGWAREAMRRWIAWDEEGQDRLLPRVFYQTGDLIMREEVNPYIEDTRAYWDRLGTPYEVLDADEVNRRWPWIKFDNLGIALYEPDAGVVRARRAIESVAKVFEQEGGQIRLGRVSTPDPSRGRQLTEITLANGDTLTGGTYIFACGPWFPKLFPELMGRRLRIPIGHVFYFATPDTRFIYPNMPSYGVPGCTGWPALGPDHRGFRVRTGGRAGEDPDTSDRWIDPQYHERPRQILENHFPDLVGAPINETRACHYEFTVSRNFIVDPHPDFDNVWLAGGGTAESFKFGPVLGEYIAKRVLGIESDPELAEQFKLREREFDPPENN